MWTKTLALADQLIILLCKSCTNSQSTIKSEHGITAKGMENGLNGSCRQATIA
jgi:hypothetical protein